MLTTLISIFASGTLLANDLSTPSPHVMPWNEDITVEATSIPHKKEENIAPILSAKSAIVVDLKNGMILYEKNIHEILPIASLTKLMTAILVLEENELDETATISQHSVRTPGSKIWMYEGEQLSVQDLLYASLINSANDAATALAEHNSGNIETFVEKMNLRAKELGLHSTKFFNPTGLDEYAENSTTIAQEDGDSEEENDSTPPASPENSETTLNNQSSAFDLAMLARFAYGKSFIRKAAIIREHIIYARNLNVEHKLENTNRLLNTYLNVLGLKTGTTDTAGQCLIAIIRNENNKDILTVVLGSKDRYEDTKMLADWTFRTFTWI